VNRRTFLLGSAGSLGLPGVGALAGRTPDAPPMWISLVSRIGPARQELVNLGVPFPPARLFDPGPHPLADERGREILSAVRTLSTGAILPTAGADASIRSVQLQFPIDMDGTRPSRVRLAIGERRSSVSDRFAPVAGTLIDPAGLKGPRVLPLLSPDWLCAAGVAGPQTPAHAAAAFGGYERFVERSFPGSLRYIDSDVYHHWLFDRSSAYFTQYVRTGDRRFLEAADHCAHFVRLHTALDSTDAGMFTLKGADVKYVYPRAMHLHYLLTGDERALDAGTTMARFCLARWDPEYRPDRARAAAARHRPGAGPQLLEHAARGLRAARRAARLGDDRRRGLLAPHPRLPRRARGASGAAARRPGPGRVVAAELGALRSE
jgi:hypothetical protein